MTYSNRPTSSPFQHRSEMNVKVSDLNLLDKINPFVVGEMNMPGTWSDPYPYSEYYLKREKPDSQIACAVEPSCDTSQSPICKSNLTAGDRTIDMCRPTAPNCPMSRLLVPERNIDPGMWVYNRPKKEKNNQKDYLMYVLIGVLILFILQQSSER